MNKAIYFPHDTNASNDPKLVNIRMRFGWKAIGMYWAIIEALHKENNGEMPDALVASMILDFYSQEEIREKRRNIEESKQFEDALYATALLVSENGITTSKRVRKNLVEINQKSELAREKANKRWGNISQNNATAMPQQCHGNAIKESKVKENKVNSTSSSTMSEDGFSLFWGAYPAHKNKAKAKKKFLTLNKELLPAILDALEKQKKSEQWVKNNGQFIPHPTTWLNGARWEDEIKIDPNYDPLREEAIALVAQLEKDQGMDRGADAAMFRWDKKYGQGAYLKYKGIFKQ